MKTQLNSQIANFKQAKGSAMKLWTSLPQDVVLDRNISRFRKVIRQIRGGWVSKYRLNMVHVQTLSSGIL